MVGRSELEWENLSCVDEREGFGLVSRGGEKMGRVIAMFRGIVEN